MTSVDCSESIVSLHEIVLPVTRPETEWVRGRALQKLSGTYSHSKLKGFFLNELVRWSDDGMRGRVAPSWRFRVAPPGMIVRPLGPDVAFLSYGAVPVEAPFDDVQVPLGAPTVAVEILSSGDERADIDDKIAVYLSAGTEAAIVVDPERKTIAIHDRTAVRILLTGDTLEHASLPGFSLDVGALFARLG